MADDAEAAGFVIVRTEAAEFISLEHRVQVKLPYWLCTHCHCQPFTADLMSMCATVHVAKPCLALLPVLGASVGQSEGGCPRATNG
jgi:hypothetical protein